MAKVIIFGYKNLSQLAKYFLTTDTEHTVVAFCVDEKYMPEENSVDGIPIISFEKIEKEFSKADHYFFIPMTYKRMNRDREFVFKKVKEKGFKTISYISSQAKIAKNALIGENCFIMEDVTIQPYAKIGNNVIITGGLVGHHSVINDNVFISAGATICGGCVIENNTFIGANSCIRDLSTIGEHSFIAMGSLIAGIVNPYSTYASGLSKKLEISSLKFEQIFNPTDPNKF